MRRLAQRGAAVIFTGLALVLSIGASDGTTSRYETWGQQLICQCGCKQVLLKCEHDRAGFLCPKSPTMRGELNKAILRGDTDERIRWDFVEKYGAAVLVPPTRFNRAAAIILSVALAIALLLAVVMVRTWRKWRSAVPAAVAPTPDAATLERLQERVHEDIDRDYRRLGW